MSPDEGAGGAGRATVTAPRVTICLGAGGVGKTTVAAALAVASAQDGRRAVVLTIDPARRLADVLGRPDSTGPDGAGPDGAGPGSARSDGAGPDGAGPDGARSNGARAEGSGGVLDNEPRLVEGPWPGQLWAAMLDPAATLHQAVRSHRGGRGLDNRLLTAITGSLSGTNEYMAAERLHQLHRDPRFDHIVVDTPPSRHAIDFLDSPARLARFVDNRLFAAVLSPSGRRFDPAGAAARLVGRLVARLVGSDLLDQVVGLFSELEGLAEGFRRRADETAALLAGPDCSYVLVTSARREPVHHAGWIADRLTDRGLAVDVVVANRLSPFGRGGVPTITGGRAAERRAVAANLDQLAALAASERQLVAEVTSAAKPVTLLEVAERRRPVIDLDELVELARQLSPGGPDRTTT